MKIELDSRYRFHPTSRSEFFSIYHAVGGGRLAWMADKGNKRSLELCYELHPKDDHVPSFCDHVLVQYLFAAPESESFKISIPFEQAEGLESLLEEQCGRINKDPSSELQAVFKKQDAKSILVLTSPVQISSKDGSLNCDGVTSKINVHLEYLQEGLKEIYREAETCSPLFSIWKNTSLHAKDFDFFIPRR